MNSIKVAVIYYSSTGTNYKLAQTAREAAGLAGAETRLRKIHELVPVEIIKKNPEWYAAVEAMKNVQEATLDDLEWADAYIFGSPTRFGNMTSQFKQFIDTAGGLWFTGKLSNKVVACFTSAENVHGGQESTLLSMYNIFFHWGCILVPPGYTDEAVFKGGGNPYGVSATAIKNGVVDEGALEAMRHMTRRVLQVTRWITTGRQSGT